MKILDEKVRQVLSNLVDHAETTKGDRADIADARKLLDDDAALRAAGTIGHCGCCDTADVLLTQHTAGVESRWLCGVCSGTVGDQYTAANKRVMATMTNMILKAIREQA